jgi:hypothetical protein
MSLDRCYYIYNNLMNMPKRRLVLYALLTVFIVTFAFLSNRLTKKADSASLTSAKVTLSNSRLSYKAGVATGSTGSSVVTIDASGPDGDTNHLFPGDVLCFTDEGQNGCIGSKTYTVASVINGTTFNLATALTDNLDTSGYAVASQSGQWTINFTTVGEVPTNGSILITIPEANGVSAVQGNNGIPDAGATVAASGFDFNQVPMGSVTVTGCSDNWGTPTFSAGNGTTDHTIYVNRTTNACAASSPISITIGGSSAPWIVNPAPTDDHTQGTADVYGITVQTKDAAGGGGNVIDSAIPRAAPVEAVLISATVDESLSLVVDAISGTDLDTYEYCGVIPTASDAKSSTVTSIPWGSIASSNHFYYSAQKLTVNTNAKSGYVVTIQESDQMGSNGNVCTGTAPSVGEYTFGSATCIRDTTCNGTCSESVMADWTDATTYPGLGYSLATVTASVAKDAIFFYNQGGRTFNAKQLADKQGGETAAIIMSNGGPVSDSGIYVCYRITKPGTQPAGYYYNVAKYTATATF